MNKDEAIIFATKFLEEMLSFFGINVAVSSTLEDNVIQLSVPSTTLNSLLIGHEAGNLKALQHTISTALQNKEADIYRVSIDIADYKRRRADKIIEKAEKWIEKVKTTGNPITLELNAADRRVVHKLVSEYSDIESFSEGEGKERHLIIRKIIN